MDEALLQRITAALSSQPPATREDLLSRYTLEMTLNRKFSGYGNPRVTASFDAMSDTEVGYLKFRPMKDEGYVIIEPADQDEEGAMALMRSGSRRTSTVNLRAALNDFPVDFGTGRKLKLPITSLEVDTNQGKRTITLLRVKRPASKRTRTRKRVTTTTASATG